MTSPIGDTYIPKSNGPRTEPWGTEILHEVIFIEFHRIPVGFCPYETHIEISLDKHMKIKWNFLGPYKKFSNVMVSYNDETISTNIWNGLEKCSAAFIMEIT